MPEGAGPGPESPPGPGSGERKGEEASQLDGNKQSVDEVGLCRRKGGQGGAGAFLSSLANAGGKGPLGWQAWGLLVGRGWRVLVLAGVLVGCAKPPRAGWPEVGLPERFSQTGTVPLPERWWLSLGDEALAGLIEEALAQQPGLLGVWARLEQAEALARKAGAGLVPTVEGEAGGARRWERGPAGPGGALETSGVASLWLGLAASYELDLWGRVRSSREAAVREARAMQQQVQVVALTLSAQIAAVWFELGEQRAQVELLGRQAELQASMLELVEARFRRGQVGAPDVLRQRQVLESVRASLGVAEAQVRVLENQLAVLVGRVPGTALPRPPSNLPLPPPLPQTGVPSELVQRRPDLRQAYEQLAAADARLAAAIAERFPRLGLSAQGTTSGSSSRELFDRWLATLAANLVAPILDGGARRAEVAYRRAVLAERWQAYRQAVLQAVEEVETALAQEQQYRQLLESLQRQLALADRTVERLRDSYSKGAVDYLRVLDALLTQQGLQRAELQTRRNLLWERIRLCRALAGGWDLSRPEGVLESRGATTVGSQPGRISAASSP
jgi:NodT family efflux transporter outer membrane factor (OMF) lipoprotein